MINKLSIIIPVYNESRYVTKAVQLVKESEIGDLKKEIIIVDDGSTDGTWKKIKKLKVKAIRLKKNKGKGYAIKVGLKRVTGQVVIIQDADLEYSPNEIKYLLQPIIEGYADVVYGSRFMGDRPHRVLFFWHMIGNKILTLMSNMFTNLNLTDMETGYKVIRTEVFKKIKIEENRFGFEPEITAKISKLNCRIYEVGISYQGRRYEEGKKINWRDGLWALWCILKYNLL
ncbi:MAG: glycosyl transferase family 2 [uncultured bacterium]|nr:MAG: glycosyl transferase family 2 [uncultured bacterium]